MASSVVAETRSARFALLQANSVDAETRSALFALLQANSVVAEASSVVAEPKLLAWRNFSQVMRRSY